MFNDMYIIVSTLWEMFVQQSNFRIWKLRKNFHLFEVTVSGIYQSNSYL